MEDELQALQERIERLLQGARRLADDNRRLRAELAVCQDVRQRQEQRMVEARTRVEAALARLPAFPDELRDAPH
jgi:uncharacterized protein (TIGR02449 family)